MGTAEARMSPCSVTFRKAEPICSGKVLSRDRLRGGECFDSDTYTSSFMEELISTKDEHDSPHPSINWESNEQSIIIK